MSECITIITPSSTGAPINIEVKYPTPVTPTLDVVLRNGNISNKQIVLVDNDIIEERSTFKSDGGNTLIERKNTESGRSAAMFLDNSSTPAVGMLMNDEQVFSVYVETNEEEGEVRKARIDAPLEVLQAREDSEAPTLGQVKELTGRIYPNVNDTAASVDSTFLFAHDFSLPYHIVLTPLTQLAAKTHYITKQNNEVTVNFLEPFGVDGLVAYDVQIIPIQA